jgi:hypothetical protein
VTNHVAIVGASGMVGGYALRYALENPAVERVTAEFARVLRASSPDAAFSFLSGNGADPTGRSRMPYAR